MTFNRSFNDIWNSVVIYNYYMTSPIVLMKSLVWIRRLSIIYCSCNHITQYTSHTKVFKFLNIKKRRALFSISWIQTLLIVVIRAGVSAKIFETETRHWSCETETLSKNSRRDRDLDVPRPRRDTRLLKPHVCNILQIFLALNFGHSMNFPTHCSIDF